MIVISLCVSVKQDSTASLPSTCVTMCLKMVVPKWGQYIIHNPHWSTNSTKYNSGAYRKLKNTYHICVYAHFLCKIDTNIWNLHKFARQGGLVEQISNLKTHLHINFYGPYSHSAATKHNVGFDVDVFSSPLQSVGRRTIFYSANAHNSGYWWLHAQRQLPWAIDHQRRSASLETRWYVPVGASDR